MNGDDDSNEDDPIDNPEDPILPGKERLQVIWEEYKLRQTHYWSSFNRFSLAVITINVLPYINPSIAKPLGGLVAIFPVIGLFIAVFCTWLLGAEYARLCVVKAAYDKLVQVNRNSPARTWWQRMVKRRIGTGVCIMFGIGFGLLSATNIVTLLLIKLNH